MALFSKRTAGKPVSKQGGSIHVTPVRGTASIEKPDFEDVYGTFYPQVLRFVYSRLNRWQLASWQLAEDIAQEVMMACYRHYEKFDPARASLKTWVFVIARNRLKNYYRSLHDEESMDAKEGFDLPSGEELVEEAVAFEESRALLKAEIAQLSERERAVIEGKYYHDKSSEELANELGMTAVNVRTVQSRARDKLKTALLAHGYVQ